MSSPGNPETAAGGVLWSVWIIVLSYCKEVLDLTTCLCWVSALAQVAGYWVPLYRGPVLYDITEIITGTEAE